MKLSIDFARVTGIRGSTECLCNRCCNCQWLEVDNILAHILRYVFLPGYTTWTFQWEHCIPSLPSQSNVVQETSCVQDDIRGLVQDALGPLNNSEVRDSSPEGDGGGESRKTLGHGIKDSTYK